MMTDLIEVNFDGLVGPSHHFGGLGLGNVASVTHQGEVSHPRAAALQGLAKMRLVSELADPRRMRQGILPPHLRPAMGWLRSFGFAGSDEDVLKRAGDEAPRLLAAAWSASAMWTANAATVSPASDTADRQLHLTLSNLEASLHRSIEPGQTAADLRYLFRDCRGVELHDPLPGGWDMRDEGAANHLRICDRSGVWGIECFVHQAFDKPGGASMWGGHRFPSRQSALASAAIARRHRIISGRSFFLQQSPRAIDAGAFHNDVVATSHGKLMLAHEDAFVDGAEVFAQVQMKFKEATGEELTLVAVSAEEIPLAETVASYLFNSQLLPGHDGGIVIVCPVQCRSSVPVHEWLCRNSSPRGLFERVEFIDLRESMSNGGGPACLRLRVLMESRMVEQLHRGCWWDETLDERLREVIDRAYPESLALCDLQRLECALEVREATRKVRQALGWPMDEWLTKIP